MINLNEDKENYMKSGFKCIKVNLIAPLLSNMHTLPQFAMLSNLKNLEILQRTLISY